TRLVAVRELREIAALAALAGAHRIAGDLRPGPDVVGKADRAAPRGAVAVVAIDETDANRRDDAADRGEGAAALTARHVEMQPLDAEAVLVGKKGDLQLADDAG